MRRPGVLRWLGYAFGARLPVTYGSWVLHDLTVRTWFLRQLARTTVQCLPVALLALLPGPGWLRVALPCFVWFSAMFMAAIFSPLIREKRLYQHGFMPEIVLGRRDE
ncbi:hypothetical protein GCM10023201_13180 [Actinomycetospora corticicola]|uniref:Uncharacterized protein n=1 Tax=Actinomycetospora corticicola TaxID=663602 RepID=A0A7Y9DZC3_9PSEU|nr:hypothetical protein [Actinomycetospora corticicola]